MFTSNSTLLFALVLLCGTTDAVAQFGSRNVAVLGRFNPNVTCNDVWGYRNPVNGKEYALLGATTGTYIIDVSKPATPIQRGFIAATASQGWRNCTTRDLKVYRQFCYVVTDCGAGMQIIDLRNPDSPRLLKTWGQQYWSGAHNIAMDVENGVAYPCGSIGMVMVDVKTDPMNPRFITSYRSSGYVHDLSIQNGLAHLAATGNRSYEIIDVSRLPRITRLGTARDLGSILCHTTWPTRDNNYCVTTNERSNGPTGFYDIRNKSAPKLVATWHTGGSSTIPHNVIVRQRIAHLSYYIAGGRFVDLSDPSKPVEVAYYDTSGSSSGFNGAWGVYVQPESGHTYISDRQSGLFVLKSKASAAYHGRAGAGTGGKVPELHAFGAAFVGNPNFKIEIENARPNSRGILIVSPRRATSSFGGLPINVDLSVPGINVYFTTNGAGKAVVNAPIPASTVPTVVYEQAFVADPAGALGLSATKGMETEIFRR